MLLYAARSRRKPVTEKTVHRRAQRRVPMRFFRFSLSDSNYFSSNDEHIWELPLSLEHRRVGLSSFSLDLIQQYDVEDPSIIIKCNLLDRSMENQNGILEVIPIRGDTFQSFSRHPSTLGKNNVNKANSIVYFRDVGD